MRSRLALGALGVAAAAYGALMLLDDPWSDLVSVAIWLVAGVLLHDLVLAPSSIVAGRAVPRLPAPARAPVVVGVVVLVAVTLLAIPVLGRFGASPGNSTLLDRNYWAGWAGIAVLIALGVVSASLVRRNGGRRDLRPGR